MTIYKQLSIILSYEGYGYSQECDLDRGDSFVMRLPAALF